MKVRLTSEARQVEELASELASTTKQHATQASRNHRKHSNAAAVGLGGQRLAVQATRLSPGRPPHRK